MRATDAKKILLLLVLTAWVCGAATASGQDDPLEFKAKSYRAQMDRDPFVMPDFTVERISVKSDKLDMEMSQLVGLMVTAEGRIAMVEDERGESFALRKGDTILGGKVARIDEDSLTAWVRIDGVRHKICLKLVAEGDR